jgi:hypothetical protein
MRPDELGIEFAGTHGGVAALAHGSQPKQSHGGG